VAQEGGTRTRAQAMAEVAEKNPQKRIIQPSEVAALAAFLCREGGQGNRDGKHPNHRRCALVGAAAQSNLSHRAQLNAAPRRTETSSARIESAISAAVTAPIGNPTGPLMRERLLCS
jgi:hypothetical protein